MQFHLVENSNSDKVNHILYCVCDNMEYELMCDSRGKNPIPNRQTDPSLLQGTVDMLFDLMKQTRMLHLRPKYENEG